MLKCCSAHDLSMLDLVLEFVDGGDLWEYINKTDNGLGESIYLYFNLSFSTTYVGERRTQDIIFQICEAMKVSIIFRLSCVVFANTRTVT